VLVERPPGAPRSCCSSLANGYFFVLDRVTGKNLLTTPFAAVTGRAGSTRPAPHPNPAKDPMRDGRLVARTREAAPTTAPQASIRRPGTLIVSAVDRVWNLLLQRGARQVRLGGRGLRVTSKGSIRAIDYRPDKIRGTTRSTTAAARAS